MTQYSLWLAIYNNCHVIGVADCTLALSADMFLALDKDMNGTLSKQELREYADGTLTEIFIERGNYPCMPQTMVATFFGVDSVICHCSCIHCSLSVAFF